LGHTRSQRVTGCQPEDKYQALKKIFARSDRYGKTQQLDPGYRRDDEIRRTIQVLFPQDEEQPGAIGEPGVGKNAIVEGLAQRIVPEIY